MRGGKITTHHGSKHGLGGKSFQKGTQVQRRVMEDCLDQKQPLMELTFAAESKLTADQATGSNQMLAQRQPQQRLSGIEGTPANGSQMLTSLSKSSSPKRLGTESPKINVDLQKLTKRHQPDVEYSQRGDDLPYQQDRQANGTIQTQELSKAKIDPLSIQTGQGSAVGDTPGRAVSKLSVDMREQVVRHTNIDISGHLIQEPQTALFFVDGSGSPTKTQNSFAKLNMSKDKNLYDVKRDDFEGGGGKILAGSPTKELIDAALQVTEHSPEISRKTTIDLLQIGEQEISRETSKSDLQLKSIPLKDAVSSKNIQTVDTVISPRAKPLRANGGSRKVLNESANFRPQELKLFEPNIKPQMSQELLNSVSSSKGSPRKLKQDQPSSIKRLRPGNVASKTVMKLLPTQIEQTSDEKVKTIDVRDSRLKQPTLLEGSSRTEIDEEKRSDTNTNHRQTNQSFATIQELTNNHTNQQVDHKYESQMSRFIPAVFNSNFSQTYADLLKNIGPYDSKSEISESEYGGYPSPIFRSKHKLERLSTEKQSLTNETIPETSLPAPLIKPKAFVKARGEETRMTQNPELQFYLKVLERMRTIHKDVVSVDAVKSMRSNYRKYLAEGQESGRGLFVDLDCQKMEKPTIVMSNEDGHDPEMDKLKCERNLYKQYNIAAIKAQGVDNLPRRWKKLSPLNRLKTKLKIDRYSNSLTHRDHDKASDARYKSITSIDAKVSQSVDLGKQKLLEAAPQSTRNMFKSLISSQEFNLEALQDGKMSPLANFEFQTLFGDLYKRETTHLLSQNIANETVEHMTSKLKMASQVSQPTDLNNLTGSLTKNKLHVPNREQNHTGMPSLQINKMTLSPHGSSSKLRDTEIEQSVKVEPKSTKAQQMINEQSSNFIADMTFMTQSARKHQARDSSALVAVRKAGSPDMSSILSLDPAAQPKNPSMLLANQKSQFADVLKFKGEKPRLKGRVGPDGFNPFLQEIEERLRNPDARTVLLEKSLVTRSDQIAQAMKTQWQPKVNKDKTIKIATRDIYDSIRVQKSIPAVPLHRMDKISRNLTVSLLEENAAERIPMREWKKQEVMLPILNTAKRNITLHTSVDLKAGNIQRQKMIQDSSPTRYGAKKKPKAALMRSIEPIAAQDQQRKASTLSLFSISTPDQVPSRLGAISPAVVTTFNNQTLRKATQMSVREEDSQMMIISRASRLVSPTASEHQKKV